jgi:hypothetical protein
VCQAFAMSLATLILAAAATLVAPAAEGRAGAQLAQAQVSVVILDPAIVRQASGLETDADAPRVQVSRRGREILFEFQ